jgi:hypothetical protein
MKRLFVLIGVIVGAVVAQGQIKAAHFPADAKWMLHLDLRALNESPMGLFVRQTMAENANRGLASLQAMSGINLTNDVDSMVIYGSGRLQTGTVMVVYGRFDMAKVTAIASGAKEFQNKAFGERSLLSWNDKGKRANLCFVDPTMAVMSQDEKLVRDTLSRVDGQMAGLGENEKFARVLSRTKERFLALQACDVTALVGANPMAQVFKQAEAVLLEVSQLRDANGVDLVLAIKAQTTEMAQQFGQAAQGIQALLQLQAAQNPEVAALAQGVKVAVQGDMVSVNLAVSEAQIQKMVQVRVEQQKAAVEARRAARQAKRGAAVGVPDEQEEAVKKPDRPAF